MKTFQRVIEENSKAYMLLVCLLITAKRMLQNTGFFELYTELKYFPFILQFLLKYLKMYTVHRTPYDETDQCICIVLANG
jgi:hypothetical protein